MRASRTLLRRLARPLLILLCVCLFGSCIPRYTLNGSSINYDIYKRVNISEFPIRAALVYPPLQQTFENALNDYVTRNTRLQVVDNNADLELRGEITGYNLSPQAVGTDAYATETRLTITVHVVYTDNKNPANNLDQSYSAYRQFDSQLMLTDVQDELCQQISDELVTLIFNSTFGNW